MAIHISSPSAVEAAGNKPKLIEEYFGKINSGNENLSIARMKSPEGWKEPGQKPEFDEYTVVLRGTLKVETQDKIYIVNSGEAIAIKAGEWVRYSTPWTDGAEYIAVCVPAFSPDTVHRDE